MKVTGTVSSILQGKGHQVHSISPGETVFAAISLMAEKNIGALPVVENDELLGIISERDYTRKVALRGRSSKETQVGEIMNSPAITVTPATTVDECLHIMTENRVRHLPVLEEAKLIGLISIGDLVNWVIKAQSATIDHLSNYISGHYHS